jgi:ribosome-binding factor A
MASTRQQKMARVLRDELSRIIREEVNDPRLGLVSITGVDVAPDMKSARVYVSVYGSQDEQQQSLDVLVRASGFLRGEFGRQINLRYTPQLFFELDTSLERGARVVELLHEIEKEQQKEHHEDQA